MPCLFASCSTTLPSHYPERYFKQNEAAITNIESNYSNIYKQKPLVIAFTDNAFKYVTVEMKTDSMRYVYEFMVTEKRLADTLQKFGYNNQAVLKLIKDMQSIKCTWINKLDYYVDDKKQNPVSYTHLDVYKRQLYNSPIIFKNSLGVKTSYNSANSGT